jgi:hypothetical protein
MLRGRRAAPSNQRRRVFGRANIVHTSRYTRHADRGVCVCVVVGVRRGCGGVMGSGGWCDRGWWWV